MKTRTRILGALALAYGLVAVVALFPGGALGEAWGRIGKPVPTSLSGEKEARFFGVLSALGAGGVEVVTYGGSGDESRGSVFDETQLANYHLLPGHPIRAVAAPEPEAVPPAGVMVGYGLHPQAMTPEFRESFPFRMRCYNLRLDSREPLPEPGAVLECTGPNRGGEWKGALGGLVVLAALLLPGLALGFLWPGMSGQGWLAAWATGILIVTFAQWVFGNVFGIGFSTIFLMVGVISVAAILVRFPRGMSPFATLRFPSPPMGREGSTGWWWSISWAGVPMLLAACLLMVALSSPMVSVAGLSNWAYKAKLLYLEGTWPDGWMRKYDGPNR